VKGQMTLRRVMDMNKTKTLFYFVAKGKAALDVKGTFEYVEELKNVKRFDDYEKAEKFAQKLTKKGYKHARSSRYRLVLYHPKTGECVVVDEAAESVIKTTKEINDDSLLRFNGESPLLENTIIRNTVGLESNGDFVIEDVEER